MRPARGVIAASIASIFSGRNASRPPRRPSHQRFAFESLESRILLSADPSALLIVDAALADHAEISQGFDGEVLVLDQGSDAVAQIADALAERPGQVSELHIVSHGWKGGLELGGATLDAASLQSHEAQLRAWADQLTADADILFYGCNLAADEAGMHFVQQLSELTGADIAASTDLTGAEGLGGDWDLEYATGSIESNALAAAGDLILATIDYDAGTDTLTFTADASQADLVTITSPAANQLQIDVGNGDTIVLGAGATGTGFTLNGASTQLIVDRAVAPVVSFGLALADQSDTLNLQNDQAGLGAVSIDGGLGNDTVTLNSTLLGGNLTLGVETVSVANNAIVDVGGSVINASSANVSITGAGAATINGGSFSAGALTILSRVVNVNADTAVTGAFTLSSSGTLAGTGDVTVGGLTTWSSGTMSGTGDTNTDGGLNIDGTATKNLAGGRTLNTAGITTWSGATADNQSMISFSGGSVINNNGTWNDQNAFAVRMNSSGTGNEFNNNGTYNRNGLTGETQINIGFDNANAVNVNGRLALGGGGTSSGSFSGVGTLELSGGAHTLTAASSITTGGATFSSDVSGGTFNLNGAYDIADGGTTQVTGSTVSFNAAAADLGSTLLVSGGTANIGTTSDTLSVLAVSGSGTLTSNGTLTVNGVSALAGSGTIQGSGTLNANGAFTWNGGAMGGTGTTNANASLDINGIAQKQLTGARTLNTAGITTWSGATTNNQGEIQVSGSASINNSGTWNDENAFTVRMLNSSGTGSFTNTGTYNRNGLTGETQINIGFHNANTVNVNAGRLALGGGGTSSGSFGGVGTLELSGGAHTLTGASSITTGGATFSSDAALGTFNLNGAYDISDGGITQVTGSTVNFNAAAADLGATLLVSGGTANIGTTSDTLSVFAVSGSGTLTSNGTLTVNGASALAGSGTIQGSGTLNANGAFTWNGGEMGGTGTTNANAGLDINGIAQKQLTGARTLNTAGITTWSGATTNNQGEILVSGSASIINTGTWNDENAFTVRMLNSSATGSFTNNGTYNRNGLTGETQINIGFHNANTVNVNAGRLALGGGGTSSGSFGGVGTLELSGGAHTLTAASSITTGGATFSNDFTPGTFSLNGAYDIADGGTTQVTGSTVNFNAAAADLGSTLLVSGGTANIGTTSDTLSVFAVSGSGTLTSNGTLTVNGASALAGNGTIQGSGTLNANGPFTWSGGTMSGTGTTNASGDLNINTSGQKRLEGGRTLNTAGATSWSGSIGDNTNEIIVTGGSDLVNTGTWNDENAHVVRLLGSTGGGSFTNNGTYNRNGLTGETQISVGFNNAGAVNVNAGRLALGGGGTSSGSFSGAGTLELSGGTHTLTATSSITTGGATFSNDVTNGTFNLNGAYDISDGGTTQVTGSTVNFNAAAADLGATLLVSGGTANTGATSDSLATLSVSGNGTLTSNGTLTVSGTTTLAGSGTIQGGGTLNANGPFTWSGGAMAGAGTTNANGDLNISSTVQKQLTGGRTLNTAGTTTWSGSNGNFNGEILLGGGATINNNGAWNDAHTFIVRLAATTGGGSFVNNGTYTRSGLTGETQVGVAFNNAGLVGVDGGTLSLGGGGTHTGSFATALGSTLEFGGGTHNLNNASGVGSDGRLLVSSGTVNTTGALTTGGLLQLTAGTLNAGGTIDATTYSQSGGVLTGVGTVSISGLAAWSAGTMSGTGTTNANGDLNINTAGQKRLEGGRTLNTAGITTWTGSTAGNTNEIVVQDGSVISNSGTWNDQNQHIVRMLSGGGTGNAFNNAGTYTRSATAGETQIGVAFNNAGVMNVTGGTISLDAGGVSSGAFNLAGGILEFGNGVHDLQAASTVSGPGGTVRFDAGTVTVAGTYDVTGTTLVAGATANFTGTVDAVGALAISSGNANFSSGELIQATTLSLTGGTLSGTDTVGVTGLATWSAGTMSGTGTTSANGDLDINTAGQKRLESGRTLHTAGTTTWSGSTANNTNELVVQDGSVIDNSGTWNDENAHVVRIVTGGGSNAFNNHGTYNRTAVTGATQISIAFNNAGATNVDGGAIVLIAGGTHTGSFATAAGTTLEFRGGTHDLVNASAVDSDGRLLISGATLNTTGTLTTGGLLQMTSGSLNAGGSVDATAYSQSGGALTGPGVVNISGLATWSAGTMSGTGTTNANGDLDINTAGQKRLEGGRTLNTAGTTTWSGSISSTTNELIVQGGSVINNSGIWNDRNAHVVRMFDNGGGTNAFNNDGTYIRSGATGETQISLAFDNSGTLDIQAGTVSLSGSVAQTGTIHVAGGATLLKAAGGLNNDGGVVSGSGTIDLNTGTLTSSGTIRPGGELSAGLLTIEGNLALTGGNVDFDLAGSAQFDAIHITGNASLSGNANISHLGGFVPTEDDAFQVVLITPSTSGNVTGTFTAVNSPAGFDYDVVYGTDDVTFHLAQNEPPVAVDDTYTTAEDTPLIVGMPGVLANDTDPDLDSLAAILEIDAQHGTVTLNADGSFTYTPDLNFNGADTFTYRASDGPLSDVATVVLTVTPVNDAPVANNDNFTINEDFATLLAVRANDTDVDGNPLTVFEFTQGGHGTVTLHASGNLLYTPDANFFGSDTFTYRVRDPGLLESSLATVTVNVAPVSDYSIAFLTPASSLGEGDGPAALTLVLTTDTPLNSSVLVDLTAPGAGSATLGADYAFTNPTTVTFAPGSATGATRTANVTIANDRFVESIVETAQFDFGNVRAVGLGVNAGATTGSHTVSITDNDSATVAISAPGMTSVSEGGASADVELTLDLVTDGVGAEQLAVEISATLPGNADYDAMAAVFGVGAVDGATASVAVAAVNDRSVEQATETFAGQLLSATSTAAVSASALQTIQVVDNDSATVTITAAGTTGVTEGGAAASVGVTLALTTDGTGAEQLDVAISANLPGNADYQAQAAVFDAGALSGATADVLVTAVNDRRVEQVIESFAGQLLGATSTANVTASGSQTIEVADDDSASVAITSPGTSSVTEGGASANIGVTLSLTTGGTGTEQLDVEVTANLPGNADYSAAAAVFGVGAVHGATADVVVTAVNDRRVEQVVESFAGQALGATSMASVSASGSQTIEVTDNDTASVAITAPGTTNVTEGGISAGVGVTLALSTDGAGAEGLDVEVSATLPGNADYAASAAVFGAGAVNGATAEVAVTAVNDRRVEQATESFAEQALSASSAANVSASTSQTIEVLDNDSASVAITTPGTTTLTEGEASADVGVTLTLATDGIGAAQLDVEVTAGLPGNQDYLSTDAVFVAGSIDGASANVVVAAVNDRRVEEATESFAAQGLGAASTASVSASGSQTIQVVDNDSASVAIFAPGTTAVTEGGPSANVGVTLTLNTAGTGAEQLDVEVSASLPGNADYSAAAALFGPGAVNGAIADIVVSAVNDRRVEQATESFSAQDLSASSSANVSPSTSQTIDVVDNDSASVAITVPGTTTVTEGGASAGIGVTLSLATDGTGTEQLDVEVSATLAGNADYAASAAVFGAGSVNGATADVAVSAVNDRRVEQVTESLVGQALGASSAANVSASTSQTIEVVDNDSASVAITAPGTTTVTEGGISGNLGVSLTLNTNGTGAEQLDVEVSATLAGNADYAASAALFGAGAVDGATADVLISALNDRRVEQATESFAGQALSASSTASVSASTSQTIEVADNDSASVASTAPGTTSVAEGGGSAAMGVTLSLTTDGTGTEQLDVDVLATLAGNDDYAATAAVFGAGAVDGATADVAVTAVNDRRVEEATESFAGQALSASSSASVSASTSQTIEVTDNDSASVAITAPGTTSVAEGGASAGMGVTLSLATDGTGTEQLDVEVSATLAGNADYAASAAVFGVGSVDGASADVAVTAVDDRRVEQVSESFAGQALAATSVANVTASGSQVIEVTDNDSASVAITSPGTTSVTEGGASAGVGVTLDLITSGSGIEQLDVAVSANLPGNSDYAASTALFAAGSVDGATADVVVAALDDLLVEQAAESFAGQALSATSAAAVSTGTSQIIEVLDDDTAVFTIDDVTVSEAAGTLTFTILVSNPLDIAVAIDVSYTDQTASGAPGGVGADYDNSQDQVLFAPFDTAARTVTVAITDDDLVEAAETFLASLSTATALGTRSVDLGDTGIGTIANDDANDAPDAVDDSYTTDEDVALTIAAPGVLANDTDPELDALSAALVTGPAHGTLAFNSDGSFTYTPDANYNGGDSFSYRASDGALSDVATVFLTITEVNDAPDAADDSYSTDEDVALTITAPGVLANDADVDSALAAQLVTGPANGTLTLNADGSFTYTPNLNYNGGDSFTYRASDGSLSDVATVFLTINAVNDAPDAVNDSYATNEDVALTVAAPGVLANDTDADGNPLAAQLESGPAHGTLVFNSNGSFTYTPDADFNGADSFTYRVNDGEDDSNVATVDLTINAVNDAPDAVDDSATTNEDAAVTIAVRANDADVDGDFLTVESVTQGADGTVAINADGTVTYTPDLDFFGTDTFTYTVSDGRGGSDTATVTVKVNAVNDAPDAQDDAYAVLEDELLAVDLDGGVLANDADVDNVLTAQVVDDVDNGTLTLGADGSFFYAPDADFSGTDTFTYRVFDGEFEDTATVTITVEAVNDNPVAADDAYATAEDTALVVTLPGVLANDTDVDGDALSVSSFGQGAHGTVSVNPEGSFTYTPDLDFHGTDTFEYTVSDGEETDTALVTISVTPVNDAPVAVDDAYATDEGVALTIAAPGVLANDTDVDLEMLTAAVLTGPANGTLTLNPDGSFTYTPNAGFSDEDSFEYTVSDGNGGSDVGRVTITVNDAGDNDAPDFVEIDDQTITEGQELRFFVVANDADHAADTLVYSATGLPTGATFDAVSREFVWVPADEESATVTFTVLDPEGASDTMEVVLTATNKAATVDAGANQVVGLQKVHHDRDEHEDDAHAHKKKEAAVSIAATFNDLGTLDTHTATIDWGDGHVTEGSVSESPFGPPGSTEGADGTITGSHTYTKAGVYTVKVTVTDDDGASRTDTLTITVKDPDKHLKAHNDRYELREDGLLVVNAAHGVLDNDRGGLGTLQARLVEGPQHGELIFNADGSFSYRPDAGFDGQDSFWYEFSDGTNVSKAVKVDLVVRDDGRREACIDWGRRADWGWGGARQANFADFLVKLTRKA
jgi:VCBS repeat-containing protein